MELLNDMAVFVEVVKAMNFRRAADATGIPNSTLSRRVSALEKSIGLRLLHRTTRRLELTEAGRVYYERCRRIVEEARLAHEHLSEMQAQPSGVLRASLPVDFANIFLAPLIVEFARRYPDITFDFDLTPRRVDLVSEPFDVAIRMGKPEDSNLVARLLANLPGHLYASAGYLRTFGVPVHPSDLSTHECLGFPRKGGWTLQRDGELIDVAVKGRYSLNSVGMIRRLATLDQGIILMPREVVDEDLAFGRLQPVLPEWQGAPIPVYALTETRLLPAKTQLFIDFMHAHLAS